MELIPRISTIICTRNRGDGLISTVESVLKNQHPAFEVIIVDQSTDDRTEAAVALFLSDPRVRYIRSNTVGAGRSRNIGLFAARGDYVAYTDDDCIVSETWLCELENAFQKQEKTAVIYCQVIAPADRPPSGHTPVFLFDQARIIDNLDDCKQGLGMGAGMALRRQPIAELGGFDDMLGPGSKFQSGEDYEIGVRAILNGWNIYEPPEIKVVHYGFRTIDEYRKVARRDWFALGGIFAKYLKCAQFSIIPLMIYDWLFRGLFQPLAKLANFQKPSGVRNFLFVLEGFVAGITSPVDAARIMYQDV